MLDLPALAKVDDVLLTHSHFDHVKDLPMMSDVLVGRRDTPGDHSQQHRVHRHAQGQHLQQRALA